MTIDSYSFAEDGRGFTIRFDDKSGGPREPEKLSEMIRRMRDVAHDFDFDLCHWGSESSMEKYYRGYFAFMDEMAVKYGPTVLENDDE